MENHARILLFHTEASKSKQIETICRTLDIRVVKVKPASYEQTLGCLAGISGFSSKKLAYTGPEFPSEMLVFSGMDSDLVDRFLAKYKEASIPPIGLKAILTPHNIFWSPLELYRELLKEHQNFQKPHQ